MARISNPNDILTSSSNAQPPNGKTILIAEDDPFIARMYETKLRSSGYQVVVKNNGRDAYETIKESHPNLIILDINMPELSGFEVLSALQNDSYDFTNSPVLILTNSSNMADREMAKKFGADYMIKAELTPRDVVERINAKLSAMPAAPSDGGLPSLPDIPASGTSS